MDKKILIATGGTGGHIYPAIVTAEELRRRGWQVAFIGAFGPAVDKISARGFDLYNIDARGFVSKSPLQVCLAAACLVQAVFSCVGIVLRFKPAVVLGFGGYSSVPAILASACLRVHRMIHEQNVCPGEANKALGWIVRKIAVSFRESEQSFPEGKVVWTGYPLRKIFFSRTRAQILEEFGLEPGRKTILVFGGSQGSRAINGCVTECMEQVGRTLPWQIIHITGRGEAEKIKTHYMRIGFLSYVKEYMDNIEDAYALADIVIARSGAGTVTELGLLGIASVLIPYPYAGSHQAANARVLERHSAAIIIHEKDLNPVMLGDKIFLTLAHALPREVLRSNMAESVTADSARRLADEVESLCSSV